MLNDLVSLLFRLKGRLVNENFTLDDVLNDIAERLQRAARDRRSAMHMPVVGTGDGDLRMMVLRACDPDFAQVRFHTDARSHKVEVIGPGAPVGLLAFDPEAKVQIRARGTGRIETSGELVDAAWAQADAYARRCYLAEAGPGAPIARLASGLPAAVEGIRPSEEQLVPARENFAVLLVTLTSLDWLYLAHNGHRRARFSRGEPGQPWQETWVIP